MARTKRLRRKEIKQPDEFITLTGQVLAWGREHPQRVTWSAVAVLVLFVVVLATISFRSARRRDSNLDLGRAMALLRADKLPDAATELSKVAQRWPSAAAGEVATLLAASSELRRGNQDSAILLIQEALNSFDALPEYLRQELLLGWGYALERQQAWNEAAEKYKSAAALPGPFAGPAVLGEARARENAGDVEGARKLYADYVKNFPDLPDNPVVAQKAGVDSQPGGDAGA